MDRLSDLPDGVLHHILSFLDTKSSVQTSVLSRRWTSEWKYVSALTFDQSSFESDSGSEQFLDQVLSLRSDCISVTRVTADLGYYNWWKNLVDRIMKYAASHGVQEVRIRSPFTKLAGVVGSVCACYRSLKVLELMRTTIDNSDVGLFSRLQLLQSLTLTGCNLAFADAAKDDDAFTNFPRLECLKLFYCSTYKGKSLTGVVIVTGPQLLNLEILWPTLEGFQINAPKLQSFNLKICSSKYCSLAQVSMSDLPSLHRANIKLSCFDFMSELLQCADLFKILYNVQTLNLEVDTFELLIRTCNLVKHQSSPFKRLKSLHVNCPEGRSVDIPDEVSQYFLGGSPNEEDKGFTVKKQAERWINLLDKIMKYSASHGVLELFIHAPYAALEGVFRSVCDCYRSLKVLELERTFIDNTDAGLFSRMQLLESLTLTGCNLCFGDA